MATWRTISYAAVSAASLASCTHLPQEAPPTNYAPIAPSYSALFNEPSSCAERYLLPAGNIDFDSLPLRTEYNPSALEELIGEDESRRMVKRSGLEWSAKFSGDSDVNISVERRKTYDDLDEVRERGYIKSFIAENGSVLYLFSKPLDKIAPADFRNEEMEGRVYSIIPVDVVGNKHENKISLGRYNELWKRANNPDATIDERLEHTLSRMPPNMLNYITEDKVVGLKTSWGEYYAFCISGEEDLGLAGADSEWGWFPNWFSEIKLKRIGKAEEEKKSVR